MNRMGALFVAISLIGPGAYAGESATEANEQEMQASFDEGFDLAPGDDTEPRATRTNLFPVMRHRAQEGNSKVVVADAIIAEGFESETSDGRTETEFIDVPFFTLIDAESDADSGEFNFVRAPFVRGFHAEHDNGNSEVNLLKLPMFALVDGESNEDGTFDNKVLKLPIIGALFRHKRTEDKEKVRFLIFSHTRDVDGDVSRDHEPRKIIRHGR